jgi:hypothetical protein
MAVYGGINNVEGIRLKVQGLSFDSAANTQALEYSRIEPCALSFELCVFYLLLLKKLFINSAHSSFKMPLVTSVLG